MCADPALRYPALMTVVVLFFVLSCVLACRRSNWRKPKPRICRFCPIWPISYDTPIIAWLSPIIAFVAITKSFLGHYIGAYESLRDLILEAAAARGKNTVFASSTRSSWCLWCLPAGSPRTRTPVSSSIIECISGPTGAAILLLLPMYAIHKLPVLAPGAVKRATYSSP